MLLSTRSTKLLLPVAGNKISAVREYFHLIDVEFSDTTSLSVAE
jgi:hypothetical protein